MLVILNQMIAHTTAIWTEYTWNIDDITAWFNSRKANNYPVLVAVSGDEVLGYSTYAQFRDKSGYRHTMEHSVYVAPHAQGRGVGKLLFVELEKTARQNQVHVLVGGIDSANLTSIEFHRHLGFEEVGRMPQVGIKNGRWLDLVFVQKILHQPQ